MRSLNDYFLTARITDVSTAGQIYVPVPDAGTVVKVLSALNGAIATADVDLTIKKNGTAMTNGVITIATSGSTYGDVDFCLPTGGNAVAEGDAIEIETDGASTNTISADLVIIIRR